MQKLTELESKAMTAISELTYAEYGFSDFGVDDVSKKINEPTTRVRGIASSLIQKGLIRVEESPCGKYELIYLQNEGYKFLGRADEIES